VDDESEVLRGIQLILGREYEVVTALGGEAALEVIGREGEFAVIISDMRMPGMSGAELLSRVVAIAPHTQRILLTGETDLSSAIAAVNEGQIFRFLTKPCSPPELRRAVAAAVERFQAQKHERTTMRRKLEVEQFKIDPLTGLASRQHLMAILEAAAYDASDGNRDTVAIFIAIDASDAPTIPGEFPWEDELALVIADRLRQLFGDARAIGRWDVGQFVVLDSSMAIGDVALVERAEEVHRVLTATVESGQEAVRVGARVGVARLADRLQWQSLIRQAAGAARDVPETHGVCLYRHDVVSLDSRNRQLVRAMRQALPRNEFRLHYQPIVNIDTNGAYAIEALIRWEQPVLGSVSPATFIPVAEQSGDIADIGRWVLWHACREIQPFLTNGILRLAVNISARQVVEKNFLPDLEKCLAHYAIPAGMLEMELTESAMASDIGALRTVLEGVRNLGVRISVDDFGTGYSSLSYLSRLPIDTIKVDRTFVHEFLVGGGTIIRAALAMAKEFGKEVIIEGVETEAMLEQVRGLGATLVQGYLFATPMPLLQLSQWLSVSEAAALQGNHLRPPAVEGE
jgi:EAL domain-containing protein (putative c-di-GMP-specific phosphodiesterase class I)/CheY-like chemotaxis protein